MTTEVVSSEIREKRKYNLELAFLFSQDRGLVCSIHEKCSQIIFMITGGGPLVVH